MCLGCALCSHSGPRVARCPGCYSAEGPGFCLKLLLSEVLPISSPHRTIPQRFSLGVGVTVSTPGITSRLQGERGAPCPCSFLCHSSLSLSSMTRHWKSRQGRTPDSSGTAAGQRPGRAEGGPGAERKVRRQSRNARGLGSSLLDWEPMWWLPWFISAKINWHSPDPGQKVPP